MERGPLQKQASWVGNMSEKSIMLAGYRSIPSVTTSCVLGGKLDSHVPIMSLRKTGKQNQESPSATRMARESSLKLADLKHLLAANAPKLIGPVHQDRGFLIVGRSFDGNARRIWNDRRRERARRCRIRDEIGPEFLVGDLWVSHHALQVGNRHAARSGRDRF